MRKILSIITLAGLCVSLWGCAKNSESSGNVEYAKDLTAETAAPSAETENKEESVYTESLVGKNESIEKSYIRIQIVFTGEGDRELNTFTTDAGVYTYDELKQNLPDGWVYGEDFGLGDYFYYTNQVDPGKDTGTFLRSINTAGSDSYYAAPAVNVESVRAVSVVDPETKEYQELTWQDAWQQ